MNLGIFGLSLGPVLFESCGGRREGRETDLATPCLKPISLRGAALCFLRIAAVSKLEEVLECALLSLLWVDPREHLSQFVYLWRLQRPVLSKF